MKWIETESGQFINADLVEVISSVESSVKAYMASGHPCVISSCKDDATARQCAADLVNQLRDSKEVTIKATVEEK